MTLQSIVYWTLIVPLSLFALLLVYFLFAALLLLFFEIVFKSERRK